MELGPLIDVGRTSDVHAFGRDAVVKVPKPGVPELWAEVEFALSDIVHRHGLPAPAARSIVVLDGRPCVVFDRVDGPTMWQMMVDDPSKVEQMAGQLARLQHRIHCAGPPEGVPDLVARTVAKVAGCATLTLTDRADLSSALDVTTERELWDRLAAMGETTVIAISQRQLALDRADQVITMANGRVVSVDRRAGS